MYKIGDRVREAYEKPGIPAMKELVGTVIYVSENPNYIKVHWDVDKRLGYGPDVHSRNVNTVEPE